jgi:nucleoside-diphosphate-sugar epimerase
VFFLYGPDEQPGRLVPSVVRSLLGGESVPASDGEQIRDFLHVSDVADGFASLLASDVCGPVNIASGEAVTVRTVIETIARSVGRPELIRWGALERGPGDPDVLLADVARLRDEVGFVPRITLEEGLMTTVDWWRERCGG